MTTSTSIQGKRIVVTGGAGFLGGEVCRLLRERGVTDDHLFIPTRPDHDLTERDACRRLYREAFGGAAVDLVIHLAAEVGGIGANQANPGRYFYANMAMALHLIEEFRLAGLVEHGSKFVQVGTICAYPKHTPVPFKEEDLFNGYPEVTNAPYGIAKRAAWQMLEAYRLQYGMRSSYVLPVNLYGPGDDFDPATSHVIPALIRKCVEATDAGAPHIDVWGTGGASREFLYVTDAAEGIIRAAERMDEPIPINLGTGQEITIGDLVQLIASLAEFSGKIRWDATKPDGQPRRCLDVTRARTMLGWDARMALQDGLARTVAWWRSRRHD
jgi:GDP-L-fucose synthase